MKVLVVDHNRELRKELIRKIVWVRTNVTSIYEASNTVEAFSALGQYDIDVMFIDAGLPELAGLALAQQLDTDIENSKWRSIPRVLVCGESANLKPAALVRVGVFQAYLQMPFTVEEVDAVLSFINNARSVSAP